MEKPKLRSKSGIYQILNKVNGKCYIGSAVDPKQRFHMHRSQLRRDTHHSIVLQRAWKKYGEANFEFLLLEECEISKLIEREQHYIDQFRPVYNISKVAGSCLGVKFSKESSLKKSLNSRNKGKFGKDNPDSIEVYQYSLEGKFLKKWYGTREIERDLGFNAANIGRCSLDASRTCYKFFWSREFLGEQIEEKTYRNREKCKKAIAMSDLNDILVRQFESQKQAKEFFNKKSNSTINAALQGKIPTAYGYKWKYL